MSERQAVTAFANARVSVRLADALADDPDARETFVFAINQILRFCPNVSVAGPDGREALAAQADRLARAILGPQASVGRAAGAACEADVTLVVGGPADPATPCVAISSTGWSAQLATSACADPSVRPKRGPANALGALAAACLGAGQVFFALAGRGLAHEPIELSLIERAIAAPGELDAGPALPTSPLEFDALLVGCGAVMNGFGYAAQRLPLRGRARAVDRQRLRRENIGAYVLSDLELVGETKVEVLRRALAPAIAVEPYAEDFDPLFTVRLRRGHFTLAPIAIAALDNVTTRHTVQRLWPGLLIDLGAGGSTSQVIRKRRDEHGLCVLEALRIPDHEVPDVQRLAVESGLRAASVLAMDSVISEQDVLVANGPLSEELARARQQGQLRCGFIRARALEHEGPSDDFEAAAPFVTAYSGVVGAAELMRELMGLGEPGSMRHQLSFLSLRARTVNTPCAPHCECQAVGKVRA